MAGDDPRRESLRRAAMGTELMLPDANVESWWALVQELEAALAEAHATRRDVQCQLGEALERAERAEAKLESVRGQIRRIKLDHESALQHERSRAERAEAELSDAKRCIEDMERLYDEAYRP